MTSMQTSVPGVLDLSRETEETKRLYGLDNPKSAEYGRRCLLARRLVEQGVRFVQVFLSGQPWDTHSKNAESLKGLCATTGSRIWAPEDMAGARASLASSAPKAPEPGRTTGRAAPTIPG